MLASNMLARRYLLRPTALLPICIVGVVALQVISVVALTRSGTPGGPSRSPVDFGYLLPAVRLSSATKLIIVGCHLLEALGLYGLFRLLPSREGSTTVKVFTVAGVATMLAVSLSSRITGYDVLPYVYFLKVPNLAAAYHVPTSLAAMPPGFGVLHHIIKKPFVPSPYGPLWQLLGHWAIMRTVNVAQAIITIKVAHAVALIALFSTLGLLRLPFRLASLFFLNPALYDNYIVEAHNDVLAILPTLVALVLARRGAFVAAAVVASLAGLMKASLVIVALATVASLGGPRKRVASAALIVIIVAFGSLLMGGSPYLHALVFTGKLETKLGGTGTAGHIRTALQFILIVVSCIALVDALVWKRFLRSAIWTFPGVSGLLHMWYFPWTISYAVRFQKGAVALAVSLPIFEVIANPRLIGSSATPMALISLVIAALAIREVIVTRGRGEPEIGSQQRAHIGTPALTEEI